MAFTIKFLDGTEKTFETLERASLDGANLTHANLTGASLYGANLAHANLTHANLTGASLYGANLAHANLTHTNLTGANLTGASLTGASLTGASLTGAILAHANLTGVDLVGRYIIPAEGAFIAYKKIQTPTGPAVLTLKILRTAKRVSSLVGRKCRASKAKVIAGLEPGVGGWSMHDPSFKYELGKVVKAHGFSDDRRVECAGGIHFYIERMEAEMY